MTRVLFVCMGNICRSQIALVVARAIASQVTESIAASAPGAPKRFVFDSAGTHAQQVGGRPDTRAAAVLKRRGYPACDQRPRRVAAADFEQFDLILAMDDANLADLQRQCPPECMHKLHRFLDFAAGPGTREVPDPYYGNVQGFERVLDLCESGAAALIVTLSGNSKEKGTDGRLPD